MPESEKHLQNKLYQEPATYEALFNPGLADLGFYAQQARQAAGPVLELGCGTGRLLWPLRQQGLAVEGLDASSAMLEACENSGKALGLQASLHHGDWRHFELGRKFSAVFLPFNGLQQLHNTDDLHAFFRCLRAHLAVGGTFVLDLHLPQAALLARDPHEHFGVEDGPRTPGGERVVAEKSSYDPLAQVLTQTWTLAGPDGATRELSLGLRQFFPQEIRMLLAAQGFEVLSHAGGFEQEALQLHSLKQVLCAKMTHVP